MSINTPVNQVRFTNVAFVRLKKGNKKFEIACYPNKVIAWRDKSEKDLDQVVQIRRIFTNGQKGEIAKKAEIQKSFGDMSEEEVLDEILRKGEIQVGEKERAAQQDNLFRDIATIVAEKCVDSETKRPLTVTMVERAMKDIHYSVKPGKNAKQQALEVIRLLKETMPIERAKMRLKITAPKASIEDIKTKIKEFVAEFETEESIHDNVDLIFQIDPSNYRGIEDAVKKQECKLEVVTMSVTKEGESKLE